MGEIAGFDIPGPMSLSRDDRLLTMNESGRIDGTWTKCVNDGHHPCTHPRSQRKKKEKRMKKSRAIMGPGRDHTHRKKKKNPRLLEPFHSIKNPNMVE